MAMDIGNNENKGVVLTVSDSVGEYLNRTLKQCCIENGCYDKDGKIANPCKNCTGKRTEEK